MTVYFTERMMFLANEINDWLVNCRIVDDAPPQIHEYFEEFNKLYKEQEELAWKWVEETQIIEE